MSRRLLDFYRQIADGGGCNFPDTWTGGWFQSGIPGLIYINSTSMQGKGECAETDGTDKFLVYDKNEECYRCLVIHEKHRYVLQYKETYCGQRDSLSTMCESITGDAALYSMFKKDPRPEPQQCPFHPAPFTFTYSRGSGDCVNPPSRAESCTDDSRLLLRYMACPDVPSTESNVEELICLATWKEGSTRYLVGLISQVQRRNSISTDEDMYRCFVYKGSHADKTVTYSIAQSGDATCNGLTSSVDGSRTMKLTNIDDEHNRCHFPNWIVEHHKWYSLDHTHQYHFTTKNATLKIEKEDGTREEKRIVCHSILEQKEKKYVKLVAHLTRGCESGHVCVRVSRRGGGVLELQLGAALTGAPQAACAPDLPNTPHVTLISTQLSPSQCPMLGRYTVVESLADRRRRRQQLTIDETGLEDTAAKPPECVMGQYDSASIGCGASQDAIEFRSACTSTVYTCYGSWQEGSRHMVVAAPASTRSQSRPHALCFIYTYVNDSSGGQARYLSVSVVSRSCDRSVTPGVAGDKAYNLTLNGTCEQSSKYSAAAALAPGGAALLALAALLARS
ncbi:unnamed protein product [Arctia plantaginis]|uniref:Uncharacterized protein n=1 Tax=Arctia plantaginis TaxID=874455 RepID=A0A8S0ZYL7_ARCPL|nr:unnamed protein product [Arctia plantaginis]CAB3252564.1 unnamed protein product [Arctia plantaginis]